MVRAVSRQVRYRNTIQDKKRRYPCMTIRAEISNTDFGLINDCYKFFKTGAIIKIPSRITAIGNKSKPQRRWPT